MNDLKFSNACSALDGKSLKRVGVYSTFSFKWCMLAQKVCWHSIRYTKHKASNFGSFHSSAVKQSQNLKGMTLPDFGTWKVLQLKQECKRLGLVTSRPKQGLIDLLRNHYEKESISRSKATQKEPDVIIISDSESDEHSKSFEMIESKSTCSRADKGELSSALECLSLNENNTPSRCGLTPSCSSTSNNSTLASDEASIYGPQPNIMDEPMCDAIFSDKQLYKRILLLEPISLDEMLGVAHRSNVLTSMSATRNRAKLRTWLDCQGICFYEAELSA